MAFPEIGADLSLAILTHTCAGCRTYGYPYLVLYNASSISQLRGPTFRVRNRLSCTATWQSASLLRDSRQDGRRQARLKIVGKGAYYCTSEPRTRTHCILYGVAVLVLSVQYSTVLRQYESKVSYRPVQDRIFVHNFLTATQPYECLGEVEDHMPSELTSCLSQYPRSLAR